MPENDVKLTKLAKCAGCGAKVGAGVLAQLLDGIQVHRDPNLLVGFDKSDDASVYKVSDDLALVQTVDFFPPIAATIWPWCRRWISSRPLPTTRTCSDRSRPPTPSPMCTPWAASPSCA